ncbi:MAG: hypothetical protein COB36_07365 [Alphaproteobacteria bacterium]|nr:MAG: hypothetical protein COB36_07365 [Alphaproteobacteria bacterium]
MESNFLNTATPAQTHERVVYRVRNERTAGFMPSWDAPKESQVQGARQALSSYTAQVDMPALPQITPAASVDNDGFSFWDLLDMVNPLQHIPVVNLAYRAITGDEIKPVSQIIGGGVFGGPVGLASGLVNVVIKEETGRDVMGNVVALVGLDDDLPEKIDAYAIDAQYAAYEDLPAALLAFAQIPINSVMAQDDAPAARKHDYERMQVASGRSAGTIAVYS